MPVNSPRDISLGNGVIEFGEYDDNGVFQGYHDIGALKGSVTVTIGREVLSFETGRPLVTIAQEVIRESVMISGTFAEMSLATVKDTLGQGVITSNVTTSFLDGTQLAMRGDLEAGTTQVQSGTLFEFGGLPTHAYIGLRFTHVKANGKRQIYEFFKASPSGNLALPFNETDWNLYSFEFRCLADTTRPAGRQYFKVLRENN